MSGLFRAQMQFNLFQPGLEMAQLVQTALDSGGFTEEGKKESGQEGALPARDK